MPEAGHALLELGFDKLNFAGFTHIVMMITMVLIVLWRK